MSDKRPGEQSFNKAGKGIQARLLIQGDGDARNAFFKKFLLDVPDGGSINKSDILYPLYREGGIVFPYTPTMISQSSSANYDQYAPTHSNFQYNRYTNSTMGSIEMTFKLTSLTQEEFRYTAACIHFLKAVTKMHYGNKEESNFRGTPPPVLAFSYGGKQWWQDYPVVLSNVLVQANDEDPIVGFHGLAESDISKSDGDVHRNVKQSMMPIITSITISLLPHYRPIDTRDEFSFKDFATGQLLGRM